MPCNSDHMQANGREKEASKVASLLDELAGQPLNKRHFQGYHPDIYSKRFDLTNLTALLCSALQETDVSKRSLEMQMWWRDHKEADALRIAAEVESKEAQGEEREAALAKLTPYERSLLGL